MQLHTNRHMKILRVLQGPHTAHELGSGFARTGILAHWLQAPFDAEMAVHPVNDMHQRRFGSQSPFISPGNTIAPAGQEGRVDDPKMYTKPWIAMNKFPLRLDSPDYSVIEEMCVPSEQAQYYKDYGNQASGVANSPTKK